MVRAKTTASSFLTLFSSWNFYIGVLALATIASATPQCWEFSGITTEIAPSNWLTNTNDILFHLTFKKANDDILIMNYRENDDWGTEIEKPLPFDGDVTVFVSRINTGFKVKITETSSSDMREYVFADVITTQELDSVSGAAMGNSVSCNIPNPYPCPPAQPFYDDFSDTSLDDTKWLVAHKTWGGGGDNGYTNGGVVLENVKIEAGAVVFDAHGSLYNGNIMGINRDYSRKDDGKRTGGAIATRDYFGAGKYEIRMKAAPELGVCSAIWTFFYKDGTPIINHEIDIELPGRPAGAFDDIDFDHALLNTWVGEIDALYTAGYTELPSRMDDNEFHTWRFDWHTDVNDRRVEFYLDNKLLRTMVTHIPFYAGRIWLGAWFPGFWAGNANFDRSRMEVDWISFTPFLDETFQCPEESYPNDGWAPPSEESQSPSSEGSQSPSASSAPSDSPSSNPITVQFVSSKDSQMCLGFINNTPNVLKCKDSDDNQIWIIFENGNIQNKGARTCLRVSKNKLNLSTCPMPDKFKKVYSFVYNEFHKTIIAAFHKSKPQVITYNMDIEEYLPTGTISPLYQWTYKRV